MFSPVSASTDAAREALRENPTWYHSIELAPGVVTPGQVDLRSIAAKVLPDDLSGIRALDVGTFDGFWAFEMERRGAEVVAIDTEMLEDNEWPPIHRSRLEAARRDWELELGRGFRLAAEALDSRVERVVCNVYELGPEAIDGPVDFVFSGAILLHLRDPVRALERLNDVLRPDGELRLLEPFSVPLSVLSPRRPLAALKTIETDFNWWVGNLAALRAWCVTAGFAEVHRLCVVRPRTVRRMRQVNVGLAARPARHEGAR